MYTVHNLRMELKCEDLVLLPRLWQTFDSKRRCGGFKFDSKLFMEILTNEIQWGLHRLAEAVALPSQFSKRTWGSSDANGYRVLAEQSYINSVNSLAWWNFKASCLELFSWMASGKTRNCWCHVRIFGLQLRDSWWIACPKSFNRLATFIAFKRIQYHSMMYRWLEKLQLGL